MSGCSAGLPVPRLPALVNQDRNHFAACMVALGDADAMVTGVTRNFSSRSRTCAACIDPSPATA
jgi:malate dehydrogenase (oxaloacetate-decarboxylating)(NADP+)